MQDDASEYETLGREAGALYCDETAVIDVKPILGQIAPFFNGTNINCISGKSLTDVRREHGLTGSYESNYDIVIGSTIARIRMIMAYGWAALLGGAQISTDNLSEFLTGFWTLCGDEGTFRIFQKLMKGLEAPQVAVALGIPDKFIIKTPTDGLGISDSDLHQLYGHLYKPGLTYIDVDKALIASLAGHKYPDSHYPNVHRDDHPVWLQHKKTDYKRNVFCPSRHELRLPVIPNVG